MRFTDHLGFTIEVWVSNSRGKPLPEYNTRVVRTRGITQADGSKLEPEIYCWIPSAEGSKFRIHFRVRLPGVEYEEDPEDEVENEDEGEDKVEYTYEDEDEEDESQGENEDLPDTSMLTDIRCCPWLDGKEMPWSFLRLRDLNKAYARPISVTMSGEIFEMKAGEFMERPYVFHRLARTDDIREVQPDDTESPEDLNEIRVKLDWGHVEPEDPPMPTKRKGRDPAREKYIWSNNYSLATLGEPVPCDHDDKSFKFKPIRKDAIIFVFQHGFPEWLSAQGVIPNPPPPQPMEGHVHPNVSEPGHLRTTPEREEPSATLQGDAINQASGAALTHTSPSPPPSDRPSRQASERVQPREVIDVDAFYAHEVIDVDALSDSELKFDTKSDSKVNLTDSKPPNLTGTGTRRFVGNITLRDRRPGAGPSKRVKVEKDVKPKLEKTEDVETVSEGAGASAPQEMELDVQLKQEDMS